MSGAVGNLHVGLTGRAKGFVDAANRAKRGVHALRQETGKGRASFAQFSDQMSKVRNAVVGGGIAAGLIGIATAQARAADEIDKASKRIGVSTEYLQEFRYAATQTSDVTRDVADMAMQRFSRRLAEAAKGAGELKGVLEQYKIAATDARGRTRSVEAVMDDLADAIKSVESPQERLRIAFKAFDSEGAGLVTTLENGSAALARYRQEAVDTFNVIDAGSIHTLVRARDQINSYTGSLSTLATIAAGKALEGLSMSGEMLAVFFGAMADGRDPMEAGLKLVAEWNEETDAAAGSTNKLTEAQLRLNAAMEAAKETAANIAAATEDFNKRLKVAEYIREIHAEAREAVAAINENDLLSAMTPAEKLEYAKGRIEELRQVAADANIETQAGAELYADAVKKATEYHQTALESQRELTEELKRQTEEMRLQRKEAEAARIEKIENELGFTQQQFQDKTREVMKNNPYLSPAQAMHFAQVRLKKEARDAAKKAKKGDSFYGEGTSKDAFEKSSMPSLKGETRTGGSAGEVHFAFRSGLSADPAIQAANAYRARLNALGRRAFTLRAGGYSGYRDDLGGIQSLFAPGSGMASTLSTSGVSYQVKRAEDRQERMADRLDQMADDINELTNKVTGRVNR